MGGRGRNSGTGARQLTIDHALRIARISEIILERDKKHKAMLDGAVAGVGNVPSVRLLKKCACCGEYSLPIDSQYEICPVCGWIDDPNQNANPGSTNGRNAQSLAQARKNYLDSQIATDE